MDKDLGAHGGFFYGGDELQGAPQYGQCSIAIAKTRMSKRAYSYTPANDARARLHFALDSE
jgi:hypothetical protein